MAVLVIVPGAVFARVSSLGLSRVGNEFARRVDSEHEQILIRVFVVLVILIYLIAMMAAGQIDVARIADMHIIMATGLALQVLAWGLLLHLLYRPQASPVRRVIGMTADNTVLTIVLLAGGEIMAPWYAIYLWVTFGMGFRYGRRYLFASAALSALGYAVVIAMSPFWSLHPAVSMGLMFALIALPAYVSTLIKKLNDAVAQAEEANRAKSRFLATMSHELRTPLNAVIGMTDLLRDTELDREQQEMATTIKTAARSLLSLINDILDFSKIEAGKQTVEITDFDLHDLLAGVRNMLAQQARSKGVGLNVKISAQTPFQLRGDAKHLNEVIVNFVANALKFTDKGAVNIVARGIDETFDRIRLRVEVRDTGIGIPDEKLDRIFESFTQADESVSRRYGGTGLGLAISKQLIELMGGRIGVESEEGRGSTFWFVVDVDKQPAKPAERKLQFPEDQVVVVSTDHLAARTIAERIYQVGLRAVVSDNPYDPFAALPNAENAKAGRAIVVIDEVGLGMRLDRFTEIMASSSRVDKVASILVTPPGGAMPDAVDLYGDLVAIVDDVNSSDQLFNALHAAQAGSLFEGVKIDRTSSPQIAAGPEEPPRRSLKILVAEDNRTNRRVLSKILERAGHRSVLAANGEEALDRLEEERFDAVLMDINMPGMSGIEATKMHRFASLGEPRIPIIALSADATQETQRACEEAGMDAFQTKPVDARELIDLIEEVVRDSGPVRDSEQESLEDRFSAARAKIATHPRFHAGSEPAIDEKAVENLRHLAGGDDFFEEVVQDYIEDAEFALDHMEKAIENMKAGEFRDHVHALRSSSANIGATRIFNLCMEISGIGQLELERRGSEYMQQFVEEFRRARQELMAHVNDNRHRERN